MMPMTLRNTPVFTSFILTFLISLQTWGVSTQQREAIDKLVNQDHRPTVAEVIEAFKQWPRSNIFVEVAGERGFPINTAQRYQDDAKATLDAGIIGVAKLEKAFPGAVFAFLGRDSVQISEVFEVIYRSFFKGERRVFRLNASTASFSGTTDEIMWQFVSTNGLTEDLLFRRPYIMLDATSFGTRINKGQVTPSSQSTYVTHGAYSHFVEAGIPPHELVRWINFVDVRNSSYGFEIDATSESLDQYFEQAEQQLKDNPERLMIENILKVPELSSYSYSLEWHPSFGQLTMDPDGVMRGAIGGGGAPQTRLQILATVYSLVEEAKSRNILQELVTAAKELRYDYTETLAIPEEGSFGERRQEIIEKLERQRLEAERIAAQAAERERRREIERQQRAAEREIQNIERLQNRQAWRIRSREISLDFLASQRVPQSLLEIKGFYTGARFDFEILRMAYQLPITSAAKQEVEGGYFSENGKRLFEVFEKFFPRSDSITEEVLAFDKNKRVIQYLKAVAQLYEQRRLSPKDLRRLILFAMPMVESDARTFKNFGTLIKKNQTIRDVLIERAQVYLTSEKNNGLGAQVYNNFVAKGWLPEPDCKDLLEPDL